MLAVQTAVCVAHDISDDVNDLISCLDYSFRPVCKTIPIIIERNDFPTFGKLVYPWRWMCIPV